MSISLIIRPVEEHGGRGFSVTPFVSTKEKLFILCGLETTGLRNPKMFVFFVSRGALI